MQFIENVSILTPSLARKIFSFFLSFLTSKVNNVTIFFYLALRLDNQELREYVDKLVVYLMDKYPGALESSKMYRWLVNILWRWYVVGWMRNDTHLWLADSDLHVKILKRDWLTTTKEVLMEPSPGEPRASVVIGCWLIITHLCVSIGLMNQVCLTGLKKAWWFA